ncbi:high-temperature-induced dauer-formation protein-domain-containing protein [Dipodascopsis tothii]|uniref:high-temperature-induced dauer-formation protein-domain-containing protein n=1 Tax=Dipodascopsis tothii TaxID=44089 RepID=UPI0034CDAF6B
MGASNSKLVFKQSVFALFEKPDIAADDPFWAQFWEILDSAEDVFSLFSQADVRRTRDTALANLGTLLRTTISHLYALRHHPMFLAADVPELSAAAALNCMRVVTRVLPFVFEAPLQAWADDFFWTPSALVPSALAGAAAMPPPRPLGAVLVDLLTDMLFLPAFALPRSGHEGVAYAIWETGIGSTTPLGTTREFESNKIETLRALLTVLSGAMYVPAGTLAKRGTRFLSYFVANPNKRAVLGVLCSLLNTTLKYNPGWKIPYDHVVFADPHQVLVSYSLQVLTAALVYNVPATDAAFLAPYGYEARNWYRFYLGRLHRVQDLLFIADGVARILNQSMQAVSAYLPGSQKEILWTPELIVLFWELVNHNKRFRAYLISGDRVHDFVVLLLYHALENRFDPARVGVVRMALYVLQTFSADAEFCVRLNRPFDNQGLLPAALRFPGFAGSYADYMLLSVCKLITTSKGRLRAFYPTLLDIVYNLAPHVMDVSPQTCTKLMHLFTALASPSFLFANETNHMLLERLLEAFNIMLEHNFQTNAYLVYAIMKAQKRFAALRTLTLDADERTEKADDGARARGKRPEEADERGRPGGEPAPADARPGFVATDAWIASWLPLLPLHTIISLIDYLAVQVPSLATVSSFPSTTTSPERPAESPGVNAPEVLAVLRGMDFESVPGLGVGPRSMPDPAAFDWTPPVVGWYYSTLWGFIYVNNEVRILGGASGGAGASTAPEPAAGAAPAKPAPGAVLPPSAAASLLRRRHTEFDRPVAIWKGTAVKLFRVEETKPEGPSLMHPKGALDAVAQSMLERFAGERSPTAEKRP